MTVTPKRKLSGKQIVTDIRSGKSAAELKLKYDLTDKALESVCTRLAAAGALTLSEIPRLKTPQSQAFEPSPEKQKIQQWRCPACNALQPLELAECPACGIIVAKLNDRKRKEPHLSGVSSDPGMGDRRAWLKVIVSIMVFAAVGSALLVWSTHRAKEAPQISESNANTPSESEDVVDLDPAVETDAKSENEPKDYSESEMEDSRPTMVPPDPVAVQPQEIPDRKIAAPPEKAPPSVEKSHYETGVLRQFSSANFQKEVIEASKTYPVLFQFYSNT